MKAEWRRVEEVFLSALEHSEENRAAFLQIACAGDAPLHEEVEAMLRSHGQAGDFIEQPAYQVNAELLVEETGALKIGELFGGYKILSLLGEGGMGEVYLAEDTQLGRKVAIKLVKRGLGRASLIRVFRREERILASLTHPNIARLYGGAVTPEGVPYFVMEYVEGTRLDHSCDEQKLTIPERLQLFRKICAAVSYAHQHLVVHRDIKPANIRVTAEGEPKLLDFGIAKLLDDETAVAEQTMTLAGMMTPDYASPEQVRGERMTTASDVYSLGVVLYELLTGQKPYKIDNRTPANVAHAITEQEPQRPSATAASSDGNRQSEIANRKSLRGDLDNIILMAMRKEPARRYQSVAQFSEDISRHLDSLPVIARKDTFAYRSAKFVKRNRIGVAAAALVLLTLLGGIVATAWQAHVARDQRDAARLERTKAERLNLFLQDMLGFANPGWYSPNAQKNGDVTISQILDDIGPRVENELADQPEVRAEMERTIGATYMYRARYDLAERYLQSALETYLKLYGEDHPETARTLNLLGTLMYFRGNLDGATQLQQRALVIYRKQQKNGDVDAHWFAAALNNSSLVVSAKGDPKSAEALLREGLNVGANLTGNDRAVVAIMSSVLSKILNEEGRLDEAEKLARASIAEFHQLPGRERPELGGGLIALGAVLTSKGQFAEAEVSFQQAESIHRRTFGDSSPYVATSLLGESYILYLRGDYANAEQKANGSLEIFGKLYPEGALIYAPCWRLLGRIMSRTGKATQAEPLLRKALELNTRLLPQGQYLQIALTQNALGECLTAQKRYAEAEPLLLESYKTIKAKLTDQDLRVKTASQLLADLYDAWSKPEQAARYR
jgi:serine/threonine-protein kinase